MGPADSSISAVCELSHTASLCREVDDLVAAAGNLTPNADPRLNWAGFPLPLRFFSARPMRQAVAFAMRLR